MLDRHIIKEGVLIFEDGEIMVDGWQANGPCMCREIAILACLHVAARLMAEANEDIKTAGGTGKVAIGLPDYHPHSFHNPNHKHVWGDGGGGIATCQTCDHMGPEWYCPKSPDHLCHYEKGDMDQCDFCGQPEERK